MGASHLLVIVALACSLYVAECYQVANGDGMIEDWGFAEGGVFDVGPVMKKAPAPAPVHGGPLHHQNGLKGHKKRRFLTGGGSKTAEYATEQATEDVESRAAGELKVKLEGKCHDRPEYVKYWDMLQKMYKTSIDDMPKDKLVKRMNKLNGLRTDILALTKNCSDIAVLRNSTSELIKDIGDSVDPVNGTQWYWDAIEWRGGFFPRAACMLVKAQRSVANWRRLNESYAMLHDALQWQLNNGSFDCNGAFFLSELPDSVVSPQMLLDAEKIASKKWPKEEKFQFKDWDEKEKMKVGFVSFDFRAHPLGDLIQYLFKLMDKSKFDIYCYSTSDKDDDSDNRKVIKEFCHHWEDVKEKSDDEVAKLINDNGIHVLYDLNGFTAGMRPGIFAQNPAPVQTQYLGWAGSTGSDNIQYFLCDHDACPKHMEKYYSEKIVFYPKGMTYFITAHKYTFPNNEMVQNQTKRSDLGLPEDKFIFANFNNLYKTDPDALDLWIEVMKQVPDSVFWLIKSPDTAVENFKIEVESRGFDVNRFIFTDRFPKDFEYYRGMALADLYLDTISVNGHTVVTDTLWAGTPVVTMPGNKLFSRVGSALVKAVGMPQFAVKTKEQYVKLAVELGTNREKLRSWRQELWDKRPTSNLFNTDLWTRYFEVATLEMYKNRKSPKKIELKNHAEGISASSAAIDNGSSGESQSSDPNATFGASAGPAHHLSDGAPTQMASSADFTNMPHGSDGSGVSHRRKHLRRTGSYRAKYKHTN